MTEWLINSLIGCLNYQKLCAEFHYSRLHPREMCHYQSFGLHKGPALSLDYHMGNSDVSKMESDICLGASWDPSKCLKYSRVHVS